MNCPGLRTVHGNCREGKRSMPIIARSRRSGLTRISMRRERGCRKVKQVRVVRLLGGARLAVTGYRVCT